MKARTLALTIAIAVVVVFLAAVLIQAERSPLSHVPWVPMGIVALFVATVVGLKRLS